MTTPDHNWGLEVLKIVNSDQGVTTTLLSLSLSWDECCKFCHVRLCSKPDFLVESQLVVRSPFRAKHHVVVQYMARWMKYPLPLPPNPPTLPLPPQLDPPPMDSMTGGLVEDKEELTTLPTPQGTSHCSCLEHCFSFKIQVTLPPSKVVLPKGSVGH